MYSMTPKFVYAEFYAYFNEFYVYFKSMELLEKRKLFAKTFAG